MTTATALALLLQRAGGVHDAKGVGPLVLAYTEMIGPQEVIFP